MIISMKNKPKVYQVIIWVLLIASVLALVKLAPTLTRPEYLKSDDFTHFWVSEKLLLQGENPYDLIKIEQLKSEIGSTTPYSSTQPITLNPPWLISLILPFGLFDYPTSRLLWLITSVVLILIASVLLWRTYNSHSKQRWLAILVAFIFAPSISVLEKGQVTTLLLIGIVGFLYFTITTPNDWLVGIFLAIASVKPQVILLFWIVLLFWVIQRRRWIILISAFITILTLMVIAILFNPAIFQQYLGMLQAYPLSDWANPTIGSYLRFFWLGVDKYWLQILPAVLGVFWFIWYWSQHHATWDWKQELPLILFVSLLTSPYYWTYDLLLLLPGIVIVTSWMAADWKRWSTLLLSGLFLGISILDLLLHMRLDEFWFLWMAPALLIWYLLARWQYPQASFIHHRSEILNE